MQESDVVTHDEASEFQIMVACECYSDHGHARDSLAQLPDLNGRLIWGTPRMPDTLKLIDADLVLIVSDQSNLFTAIGRSIIYNHLGWAHLLIYLQDETEDLPAEVIPGLVLLRSQLAAGLLNLIQILIEPVITPGLVGVDWADVRNILTLGGQVVMERASSTRQPEEAIKRAVSQLQARTAGRAIHGLQAAILSNGAKMPTKSISDLSWACKDGLLLPDKDSDGYDAYFIVAAPLMDWLDDDYYDVRLFAKVECSGARWPSDLLLDFSD
jgi:hypothetical protein